MNPDERTSLLTDVNNEPNTGSEGTSTRRDAEAVENSAGVRRRLPHFPTYQVAVLLLIHFEESVSHFVILPFVNQLVYDTGITHGDFGSVGYYAGIVSSSFFVAEAALVLTWGRLSDKIGRKPVLVLGSTGLAISMVCFGLSRTFWALCVSRAMAGALNGNIGVAKATMAEICEGDDDALAKVVAYVPVTWESGATLGPLLGGVLAHPYERHPSVFGKSQFLKKYPYFLSCAAAALFPVSAAIMACVFLRETRPKRSLIANRVGAINKSPDPARTTSHPSHAANGSRWITVSILVIILNYAILSTLEIAFWPVFALFLATPIEIGGLGLSESTIGIVLGITGVANGCFQALFFAKIQKRFGPIPVLAFGFCCFVPMYLAFPTMAHIAHANGKLTPAVWIILASQLALCLPISMTWSCIFILITAASPAERLGAINGLCQTTASVMRAIGPAAATTLFALSVEKNVLDGWLIYVVAISIACAGVLATKFLSYDRR